MVPRDLDLRPLLLCESDENQGLTSFAALLGISVENLHHQFRVVSVSPAPVPSVHSRYNVPLRIRLRVLCIQKLRQASRVCALGRVPAMAIGIENEPHAQWGYRNTRVVGWVEHPDLPLWDEYLSLTTAFDTFRQELLLSASRSPGHVRTDGCDRWWMRLITDISEDLERVPEHQRDFVTQVAARIQRRGDVHPAQFKRIGYVIRDSGIIAAKKKTTGAPDGCSP